MQIDGNLACFKYEQMDLSLVNWEDFETRAHCMPCRKLLHFVQLFKCVEIVHKDELIKVKTKMPFLNKYLFSWTS